MRDNRFDASSPEVAESGGTLEASSGRGARGFQVLPKGKDEIRREFMLLPPSRGGRRSTQICWDGASPRAYPRNKRHKGAPNRCHASFWSERGRNWPKFDHCFAKCRRNANLCPTVGKQFSDLDQIWAKFGQPSAIIFQNRPNSCRIWQNMNKCWLALDRLGGSWPNWASC